MIEINFLRGLKFMEFKTGEKINDFIRRML
jgi:hypothetical protein